MNLKVHWKRQRQRPAASATLLLDNASTETLRALRADCLRVLTTVCEQVAADGRVSDAVRDLMDSEELLPKFLDLSRQDPQVAELVLHASIATLANAQSMMVVDAELNRRAENN